MLTECMWHVNGNQNDPKLWLDKLEGLIGFRLVGKGKTEVELVWGQED